MISKIKICARNPIKSMVIKKPFSLISLSNGSLRWGMLSLISKPKPFPKLVYNYQIKHMSNSNVRNPNQDFMSPELYTEKSWEIISKLGPFPDIKKRQFTYTNL